jgi:hypothetical protein
MKGLKLLIPDVLLPRLLDALKDLGAEITENPVKNEFRPSYFGVLNANVIVIYEKNGFAEIICKHQPTYATIQQLAQVLIGDKNGND